MSFLQSLAFLGMKFGFRLSCSYNHACMAQVLRLYNSALIALRDSLSSISGVQHWFLMLFFQLLFQHTCSVYIMCCNVINNMCI